MSKNLAIILLWSSMSVTALAEVVTFQQGVNGYSGTVDVAFEAIDSMTPYANDLFISVDESDDGFPNQAALKFSNIFTNESGLVPLGEEILYAELELIVDDETSAGAEVSFNRVLGPDLNRRSGAGPWSVSDTWDSLGGDDTAEGNPPVIEDPKPIDIDSDEAAAAPETFDPDGNPRGILPSELTVVNINDIIAGDRVTIDVTDSLQAWQGGASNLGWAINIDSTNSWTFLTSDWSVAGLESPFDQALWQNRLTQLNRTEAEVHPLLRVAFGVSGDIDGGGGVTMDDFNLLLAALGNTYATRGEPGDLDFDRDVDLEDFARFKLVYENINGAGSFAALTSNLPEPTSGMLTVLMLSCSTLFSRLRRKSVVGRTHWRTLISGVAS